MPAGCDPSNPGDAESSFEPGEAYALSLDAADPLARCRGLFHVPLRPGGAPVVYLCGNSLGLQPRAARAIVEQELRDWAELAVDGHFRGRRPWYSYHEHVREPGARLVGALPHEVVYMNGLTVNLHLLMVSFYRPTRERYRILIEDAAFPSDTYAARTQLRFHGIDPDDGLLIARPRAGEHAIREDDLEALIEREGRSIAVSLLSGVNFFTGQAFDVERITRAARRQGCTVGFDLAHAAGNVELRLHDWGVDFAAWCSYKYLNAGPGAVAGCFIHERHARDVSLPRFGGWWGNDPATRFRMHLEPEFRPVPSADAWQLSNPPILSMAPLIASLAIFDEVGMAALRAKSLKLTGYLEWLLENQPSQPLPDGRGSDPGLRADHVLRADQTAPDREKRGGRPPCGRFEIITPRDPRRRGCQLSILAHGGAHELQHRIDSAGVVCDFREPNVIRVAPVPLYNSFHDVWRFAQAMR